MIQKHPSSVSGHLQVTFKLPADLWADKINVIGDFNNWDRTAHTFLQSRDGSWKVTLELPQGYKYRFLYCIDGELKSEFAADSFETDPDRQQYSVLHTM